MTDVLRELIVLYQNHQTSETFMLSGVYKVAADRSLSTMRNSHLGLPKPRRPSYLHFPIEETTFVEVLTRTQCIVQLGLFVLQKFPRRGAVLRLNIRGRRVLGDYGGGGRT